MKAILSTVLFLLSSFFVIAQEFEFIVETDNCQCVYLQVIGPEIDFFEVQFTISDGFGNVYDTLDQNPTEYCQLQEGQWFVNATVSSNGNIFWEGEDIFEFFYQFIEIYPISICDEIIGGTTGGCATAYANELATYEVFPYAYGVSVVGGEIISESSNEVTILWGEAGQGNIIAFGNCFEGFLCVNIEEGPEASFTATPPIVNNTIEACAGQNIFFENRSTNAIEFSWETGTGENFSNTNLQYAYQNPGTYEVSLIAFGPLTCLMDTTMVTVEVDEGIAPTVDCIGTVCAGEIVTYTSSDDCGVFDWTVSNNGVITNGGSSTDDFITIEWMDGHIGTIELSVSSCTGDYCTRPAIVQVPIISPGATITGDATVCNNTTKTYSLPNYTGTEFNWSVTNRGTIESGQGTNEITVSWSSGTVPLSNQYVRATYENCYLGCGGSGILDVSILPEFFASGPIEGCENGTGNFTANRAAGGTANVVADWTVTGPDGSIIQTEIGTTNFTANWSGGPGNYRVIATSNVPTDYCTDEYILNVNVLETPPTLTSIEGVTEICPGQPYTYKVVGEANHTFQWSITNGANTTQQNGANITVTWEASGPYTLSVTQTNTIGPNCVSDLYDLTINPIPTVSIAGNSDACIDEQGLYTATSIDNIDYNWTIIPATAGTLTGEVNSATPEVLWHEAGTATLELAVCGQMETIQVEVHGKPEPTVLFPGSLCANEVTTISTTTTFDSYQWINENGNTVSTNPTPDLGPGYYELVVTNNFGCMEDTTFFIDPLPTPKIRISSPMPIWFCPGSTFPTLYAVDTDSGYDFEWFMNGVSMGTNSPTFTTMDYGDYQVRVTDENGCQNLSNILSVIDICDQTPPDTLVTSGCSFSTLPSFVKDFPAPICDEHSYTSTTTGHIPGTLRWSFDDNSPIQSGPAITHRFNEAGFYRVRHYAQFDDPLNPGQIVYCGRTRIDTVLISAAFDSDLACPGGTTQFTDISTFLPITNIDTWSWDFGDPASGGDNTSSDINPTHIFSNEGNYDVTLTITDPSGCISVRTQTITVHPRPNIDFLEPTILCEATAMEFNLNVLSGIITSVSWDFGNPASGEANNSTLENSFHQYDVPGSYDVTLFATNIYGCTNSFTRTINVLANLLNGEISLSQPSPLCEGESITLTAPTGGISWLWSTGETTPTITVNTEDVYSVTITDSEGCSYTPNEVAIDILPAPAGTIRALEYDDYGQLQNYYYDNPHELCDGEDLFLEITTEGNHSYTWNIGSNQSIIEFSEERGNLLSAGTYDYSVVVTDNTTGCTVEVGPMQVTVHELPAAFTISSAISGPVCAGSNTVFRVDSPNAALTYRWSNGEVGQSITVSEGGNYWVTAINSFGCETESNQLTVLEGPNVDLVPGGCHTRCAPDTICVPAVSNVSDYQWYLDGNPIAGATMLEYVAMNSGFYQLAMVDNAGCTMFSEGLTLTLSTGFGHIRGFVYDDVNQNMMVDAGDSLLTNVTVNLLQGGAVIATRISNQNAEYIFENTPSGNYTVQVDASTLPPNYMPIIEDVDVTILGCDIDQLVSLLVQETQCPILSSTLTLNTCNGTVVPYEGMLLSPGITPVVLTSAATGCDSTVTVTVVDNSSYQTTENYSACTGTNYDYFGTPILAGTSQPITFTSAAGCDSIVTVTIAETQTITTTENYSACTGTNYDYFGTPILAGTSQSITFTSAAGCDSIVTIMIIEYPEISFATEVTETCSTAETGTIEIVSGLGGSGPYSYELLGTGTSQTSGLFESLAAGDYELMVTDANGCSETAIITVPEIAPLSVVLDDGVLGCGEEMVRMVPEVGGDIRGLSYEWSDGSTNFYSEVGQTGPVSLTVNNICGSETVTATITAKKDNRDNWFYIPNVFSPNGDNQNDYFQVMPVDNIQVLDFEMRVIGRWGGMVYSTKDISQGWSGNEAGKVINSGVYIYQIRATIETCGEIVKVETYGDVTLLR